ncbi:MAG TPA: hypothetical protein VFW45_03170 [Candidatus Polarisedimenticolia bacterium]|nr:hypothetical protein [Candidatus Polarisedimenticolia bacterium]
MMIEATGSALRVGVILDQPAPRWVHQAVRAIQALPEARIVLLVQIAPGNVDRGGTGGGWNHAAYQVFQRLDRRLYGRRADSLEESDVASGLPGCPMLALHPGNIEELQAHRLDVLIDFRRQGPPIEAAASARLGVWSYRHGATPRLAARPPAFREVAEGKEPFFSALVSRDGEEGSTRLLYASWSPTHKRSVYRTLDQCLPKLAQFPARVLRRLHSGDPIEARGGGIPEVVMEGPYRPTPPGNGEVVTAVAKLVRRFGRDLLGGRQVREGWRLACAFGKEGLSPRPDRILPPPRGTYQADPFPIATEDGYWIFFEEIPASGIGHLSVMKMDAAGACDAPRVILQQPTHLSYPGVYRIGAEWYLLPESAGSGNLQLYRATRFPFEWVEEERLLEGARAYDATLVEIGGRWWMFVNHAPEGGSTWDELHLYHAERPQGPWIPHPRNPVVSDARRARPAGHLFEYRGAWYRPGQDCGTRYGKAIVVNRIVRIDEKEYEEVEAARILPDWDPRVLTVHTLNRAGNLTMLDCIVRDRRRDGKDAEWS